MKAECTHEHFLGGSFELLLLQCGGCHRVVPSPASQVTFGTPRFAESVHAAQCLFAVASLCSSQKGRSLSWIPPGHLLARTFVALGKSWPRGGAQSDKSNVQRAP